MNHGKYKKSDGWPVGLSDGQTAGRRNGGIIFGFTLRMHNTLQPDNNCFQAVADSYRSLNGQKQERNNA